MPEDYYQITSPMSFFEFGMDRSLPQWRQVRADLPILHLGPGKKGGVNLGGTGQTYDLEWPEYDFDDEAPLNPGLRIHQGRQQHWNDGSVGGVVATHVLEHLRDPRPLIWEVARVLAPGAPFNIVVPKAGTNLFWQDLDHKTGFVLDTWKTLLDTSYYAKGKNAKWSELLEIGFNAEMAIKDGNVAIVTQLIKRGPVAQGWPVAASSATTGSSSTNTAAGVSRTNYTGTPVLGRMAPALVSGQISQS